MGGLVNDTVLMRLCPLQAYEDCQLVTRRRIPRDASEQDIHEFITEGGSGASVESRCNLSAPRHQIISLIIRPLGWLAVGA
jgi:hypothetical protein